MASRNKYSRENELMDVEIKFGGGRTDIIKVHFDDDPYDLAEDFVDKHGLKQSHVKVIANYIRDTIEQYLAEESDHQNDSNDDYNSAGNRDRDTKTSTRKSEESYPYRDSERSTVTSDVFSRHYEKPPITSDATNIPNPGIPQQTSQSPVDQSLSQASPPSVQSQPQQTYPVSMESDKRSPTTPVTNHSSYNSHAGLPPLHPPAPILPSATSTAANNYNNLTSSSHDSYQQSFSKQLSSSIPRSLSESPPTVPSGSNFPSSASRARLNSAESVNYGRTRQNSVSSVGYLTRKNSDHDVTTPYRYSVRSPEYYLEPHRDDDEKAFDRGAHRRNSEVVQMMASTDTFPIRNSDEYNNNNFSNSSNYNNNSVLNIAGNNNTDKANVSNSSSYANGNTIIVTNNNVNIDEDEDEAKLFQNLRSEVDANNFSDGDGDEDDEARLYEQLQRGSNKSIGEALKPVSKSLVMGKKSMLPNSPGMINNNNVTNGQKKGIVGKSVSDRLHNTAELMRRKKEMLSKKAAAEEQKKLEESKFQLNKHSQEITERMVSRYKDGDIATKLYEEGMKTAKEKKSNEEETQKFQEAVIRDWSCVKCGTFYTISHAAAKAAKWSRKEYVCSKCGWIQQDVQTFKPTNIGLSLNEESAEFLKARQNLVEEEGRGNVHEYLYTTGMQREKILHFNRELWEEIDAQMPFTPTIPESSKRILNKYKRASNKDIDSYGQPISAASSITESYNERDDVSGISLSTHFRFNSRLTGAALQEYLNRPMVERLVNTQTRSVMDEAIMRDMLQPPQVPSSLTNGDERKKFMDRLVYEYKDKEKRLEKEEKRRYAVDPITGQKLFQPKVPEIPEELRSGRSISTGKSGPIWEKLVAKKKETEIKKLRMQKKAVEDTLKEIRENQVKALPSSNEILQESTTKNLEELFRLLLACNDDGVGLETNNNNNEFEENDSNTEVGELSADEERAPPTSISNHDYNKINNSNSAGNSPVNIPKINTKRIHMISQNLENWQERRLDLAAVQPALMINEVSTLLLDMKKCMLNQLSKTERDQQQKTRAENAPLLITFSEFKQLALKCIRYRNGPGKGYIFAPKKKPELALQLQKAQELEETFHPEIDKRSQEITKGRQEAYRQIPIEDMLQADIGKKQKWLEEERQKKEVKEKEALSFKPILHKPPSHVNPKYRKMDLDALDAAIADEENEEDEVEDILERRFDLEEDDPTQDIPVSLAHKMHTLQNTGKNIQISPMTKTANNTSKINSTSTYQSNRSKVSAMSIANDKQQQPLSSFSLPLAATTNNGSSSKGGLVLQTPTEVRLSRFTLSINDKPPVSQKGTTKGVSEAEQSQIQQQYLANQQTERDDCAISWGVAPEDIVSSTQGSSHRHHHTRRDESYLSNDLDNDAEHPSMHRRLRMEELSNVNKDLSSSKQALHHQRRDKLDDREYHGRIDRSHSSSPSCSSMSTITADHLHEHDDIGITGTSISKRVDVSDHGALLLTRPDSDNDNLMKKPSNCLKTSSKRDNLSQQQQVSGGGRGGGYLQRMMSSQSNRSLVSNHSLTVSRSNNSSFMSHHPKGGIPLTPSNRTAISNSSGNSSVMSGLPRNSTNDHGHERRTRSPSPPPPPPLLSSQQMNNPPGIVGNRSSSGRNTASNNSNPISSSSNNNPPLLPAEILHRQQKQQLPPPPQVLAQVGLHPAPGHNTSSRMSMGSTLSTLSGSTKSSTVVRKK